MSTRAFAILLVAVCLPFLVVGQAPAAGPSGPGGHHQPPMNGSFPMNGTLPDCEGFFNGTMPLNGTLPPLNGTMPPMNGTGPANGECPED